MRVDNSARYAGFSDRRNRKQIKEKIAGIDMYDRIPVLCEKLSQPLIESGLPGQDVPLDSQFIDTAACLFDLRPVNSISSHIGGQKIELQLLSVNVCIHIIKKRRNAAKGPAA
jgi:hypothetical protein